MKTIKYIHHQSEKAAMNTATEPKTDTSPATFLSLPAELRNEIYSLSGCLEVKQADNLLKFPGCEDECLCDCRGKFPPCGSCEKDRTWCHICMDIVDYYCPNGLSALIWVNRNSCFASKGGKAAGGAKRARQSLRHFKTSHRNWGGDGTAPAAAHGAHIRDGVEQPAITRVCKRVREDTLPMFYGSYKFLFTLFDTKIDTASICKWMRTIGKNNTALLREVVVVVRSKAGLKFAENQHKPILKRLGLRTEDTAEWKVIKLEHPFCYCESCIREAVKMDAGMITRRERIAIMGGYWEPSEDGEGEVSGHDEGEFSENED